MNFSNSSIQQSEILLKTFGFGVGWNQITFNRQLKLYFVSRHLFLWDKVQVARAGLMLRKWNLILIMWQRMDLVKLWSSLTTLLISQLEKDLTKYVGLFFKTFETVLFLVNKKHS